MEPETLSESTGGTPNSLTQKVEVGANTPERSKPKESMDPSTSPLPQSLSAERRQQSGRKGRARGRAGARGFRGSIDEIKPGGLASATTDQNKTLLGLGPGSSEPSGVGVLAEYVELKKPEAAATMWPAVPPLPPGQHSVTQAEPSAMSATGESTNFAWTSMTGPATGYGASNPASYNELSKPSGQAHQLEGQLQLVQASKPSRNSTVSTYSPTSVSKVMPGCITGTSVQNVCSAESPADIRATTLMVTTSEMPPLLVVSPRQSSMSGIHSLQNPSCTSLQQQDTNSGALRKDNTEKPCSTNQSPTYMLFSSLSSKISKSDLEIYCDLLDNVEAESIDFLGNGKARALISGLTSEDMSRIKTKTHKLRGGVFYVDFIPVFTQDDGTGKDDSETDAIEVKSTPDVIVIGLLEMYFENPRSGGSQDCVKEIKLIDSETAHVIFRTPEAAACVLAKESHFMGKKPLKLQYVKKTRPPKEQKGYEPTKLLLQKIPADVDDEFFQLYLSTRLKMEVENDFKVERVGDVAVITFTREYLITELEKMISSVQEKPLRKAKVEAELYKVCSSIRISNVTESDHYNDDFLDLYFESKNSGGDIKVVQSVELLGNGEAVISFEDPKDAQEVLKHSHSSSLGDDVSIELNDPLCIAKQDTAAARPAISSRSNTSEPTSIPKNTNSFQIKVKPLLALSINRNTRDLNHRLDKLQVKLEIEAKTGNIIVTSTKQTPAHWQTNCKKLIESYIQENFSVEKNLSIPKDAFTDILGQLSNLQNEAPSFVFNFGENNDKVSIAGERRMIEDAKKIIKDISDRYTIIRIDIPLSAQEFTFLVTFKLPEIKKLFSSVTIDPQEKNTLSVSGTVKDTHELCQVVNELKVYSEVPIIVEQRIDAFLKSTLGYQKLLNFVHTQSYPLAVHSGISKICFLCEVNERKSADDAIEKLNQALTARKDPLPKSFAFLQSQLEDYPPLCQELETQNKVMISTHNNELIVVGFQEDVQQCSMHLLEYIKEKCTDEAVFTIEAGIWRLFRSHMQAEWLSITYKCTQLEVACKEPTNGDEDSCTLIFKGDKFHVEQIANELSSIQAKVCKRNIEKNQTGTCKYFRSEKARTYLDGIEARRHVAIEVTEADETVLLGDNCSAKFIKKCTAFLPKGGKKLNILVGDITEFDGTDVIVNAANEDLKHIGGVALAIAKKGGPIIQTDSDNFVRKHGKVDTGTVWLTDGVGNLPCKALVHAVGPRWQGGARSSKDEALLRKSCFQSLQSCHHKFRSISFPAISSGVYGFPLDKCALAMVKTFIEYSEKHASSTIQEINIVLYKEQDSSAFISTLQRLLPKANIQMEQAHKSTTYDPHLPSFSGNRSNRTTSKGRKKKANASVPLHQGSAPIKLHRGGLLDVQADVYVNSTNRNLDLSQGAVAQALLRAGGHTLQTECTAKSPIRTGEVVPTKPGNIQCQYILHTVVPNFDQPGGKAEKVLRKVIRSCLDTCSKLNVSSVAFPSIGTGNLRFPNNITAEVMVNEIQSFFASSASSISTVHLVIFMADTHQAFQTAIQNSQTTSNASAVHVPKLNLHTRVPKRIKPKSYSQPPWPVVSGTDYSLLFGRLQVSIIQGDIGDQDTDTIVVPTNPTMQLAGQGVAGAILRKGGNELQETCTTVLANVGKLTEGKVLATPVTGALKSRSLFHIVFESNDDKKFVKLIVACLQEAEKLKYKSIALPAIGTGIHGYPAQDAARGMHKAIQQVSPNLLHLKQIRIVLYSHDDCSRFIQVFQNPVSFETPGLIERAINYVFPSRSEASASESPVPVTFDDTTQEVVIRVYGGTNASVDAAEKDIEKLIKDTFISKEVESRFINDLSPEEVSRLRHKAKEIGVYIEIDPDPLNTLTIKGDESNVHKMHCFAIELLSEVQRTVKMKEDSEQMYKTIRWLRTDSKGEEEEYSLEENFEIENAYRYSSGKGKYRHVSPHDRTDFTINFEKNEEIDHTNGDFKSSVSRVDVLKKVQEETPKEWVKMPINPTTGKEEIVHVVDLDSKSQEYQDIQQRFNASMGSVNTQQGIIRAAHTAATLSPFISPQGSSIIKIQRIQNPTLYSQYIARRNKMDKLNPQGCQNERQLFHGTKPDNCPTINHGGFNRSYCGQNATLYGKGVYFANDAEYSARGTYSPPDANGYKYIYLARVLTGEFTKGAGGMLVPPVKDPSKNAHITFDSVVDRVAAPGIFVVFQDAQNYPEYLITFT